VLFVQVQRPVRFKTSPQTRFCMILKTWTDPPGEGNGGCNTLVDSLIIALWLE